MIINIGITVTLKLHGFFFVLWQDFFFFCFQFHLFLFWLAETAKSTEWDVLYFLLNTHRHGILAEILYSICITSRKLSNLDEPDIQDTAGEAGTSS